MEFETVETCPVCGNHTFTHLLSPQDFPLTREQFQVVKCTNCGLGITNPRPSATAIGKYYDANRYISHSGGGNGIIDRVYRAVRTYSLARKLELISRFLTPGLVLDYGCGTGEFLKAAKRRGWDCTGIEPSAEARKKITSEIPVHSSINNVNGKFNLITMWHVLEHVHDLNETFSLLREKLFEGGIILVAVPNPESYDALHYGKYWAGYDVPRHLWHFSKKTIRQFLASHKLTLLEIQPMKFDAFYVSLLSESYKAPGRNPVNALKAFTTGLRSNAAARSDNHSSLIYIARS